MTITSKLSTLAPIRTIANLSTRKRTFMVILNPDMVTRPDWFVHVHVFGVSFVYFSLTTETVTDVAVYA